jgi:hypothetical protein
MGVGELRPESDAWSRLDRDREEARVSRIRPKAVTRLTHDFIVSPGSA